MIGSRDGEVVEVHRARNAANSALKYVMDPKEQLKIYTAIEDAGLDLGAIYHSHTRSDPVPSQTDVNLAKYGDDQPEVPRHAVPDRRRRQQRAGHPAVVHRRQRLRAGRVRGHGVIWLLVCPVCDAAHEPHERFCADCGVPLTFVKDTHLRVHAPRPQGQARLRRRAAGARRHRPPPGRGGDDPEPAAGGGHPVARARARAASTCPTSSPPARATSSSPPPPRRPRGRSWATAARTSRTRHRTGTPRGFAR